MQSSAAGDCVNFIKLQELSTSTHVQPLTISHVLNISSDMSWYLSVYDHKITAEHCSQLFGISTNKISVTEASHVLCTMSSLNVCSGNPDEHLLQLADVKKGKFLSVSGDVQIATALHLLKPFGLKGAKSLCVAQSVRPVHVIDQPCDPCTIDGINSS